MWEQARHVIRFPNDFYKLSFGRGSTGLLTHLQPIPGKREEYQSICIHVDMNT